MARQLLAGGGNANLISALQVSRIIWTLVQNLIGVNGVSGQVYL